MTRARQGTPGTAAASDRPTRFARLSAAVALVGAGLVGGFLTAGRDPAVAQAPAPAVRPAAPDRGGAIAANLCTGCHSPPDGPALSGMLTGRWLSPNITPDPVSGIGAWSRDELFRYLRHGQAPGRGQAGGPMARVIEALQGSPDADLHALVEWTLGQPAHRDPADTVPASERGEKLRADPALLRDATAHTPGRARSGAALYNAACASCHGAGGAGSRGGHFPSLFRNSSVGRRTPYNLVASLLDGVERHVGGVAVLMQSFDGERGVPGGLSEGDLAAVSNFVLERFGDPSAATITEAGIERSRLGWWGAGKPAAERGQLIAVGGGPGGTGSTCFACHGLQGQGDAGSGSPRLSGLDAAYFTKQMRDYASGSRPHGAMTPIAQRLDAADWHSLALYYVGLPAAPTVPVARPEPSVLRAGEDLYARGAPGRGVQACAACHGPAGQGFDPVYPSVVQPASYTAEQLRLWRDGTRHNDPHDLMGGASRRLSDEDIRAVSAYLGGLAP